MTVITIKSTKFTPGFSFQSLLTAFYNTLAFIYIGTVLVAQCDAALTPRLPTDVIQEIADMVIDQYSIGCIHENHKQGGSHTASPAKKKMKIEYDRAHAQECIFHDRFYPMPRFDDRQFEQTFQLKRRMVEDILNKLASYNPFWTDSRGCCGELSISPHVKFFAAQKMICYGVSFLFSKTISKWGEYSMTLYEKAQLLHWL